MLLSALILAVPATFTPGGKWVMDYQPKSCILERSFIGNEHNPTLALKVIPGSDFVDAIIIDRIASPKARFGKEQIVLGPDRKVYDADYASGVQTSGKSIERWQVKYDLLNELAGAANMSLTYNGSSVADLAISQGSSAKAALTACEDDLLRTMHVDPIVFRSSKRPQLRYFASLFNSGVYPAIAVREHKQGRAVAVVVVTASGTSQSCDIVDSAGDASLDEATCQRGMRAHFEPARDPAGKPVAGWYVLAVRWVLPN